MVGQQLGMQWQLDHKPAASQPLRIALLSWESMHSVAVGGIAAHVTELAAALCRRGHDVHLFTRMGAGQSRYDNLEGVHYHRCAFDPHTHDFLDYVHRMCSSFVTNLKDVECYLDRPFDIVHGHDWMTTPAIVEAKNELRRSIAFTVHSTEYGRCGNRNYGGQSERVRHYEWEGIYVANRVICVSKALRREVQWLYNAPTDKTTSIYNGVNAHKFDTDINIASVRNRHGIGVDDPMILFAGRLAWQKGPDLLVNAMPEILSEHPRCKFVFAGDGDMRSELESRTLALGNHRSVQFLGHRNGLELISLFKSADMVCVPSRNEPFGIVILEAWSARKPVVVTRNGGPAEFVEHNSTGITVSDDIVSVGNGVCSMLSGMDHARQMGNNGRKEAETHFSWNTIAAQTENVYISILHDGAMSDGSSSMNHAPRSFQETGIMARRTTQTTKKKTGKKATTTKGSTSAKKVMTKKSTSAKVAPKAKTKPRARTSTRQVTDEAIRQRAFEIYLARNGAPGDPAADWAQAERELRG